MTTYTISTAKGSHTGSLRSVCRWQSEQQGAMATIGSVNLDGVDFDADEIDDTVVAVEELLMEARWLATTNEDWAEVIALGGDLAALRYEAGAVGDTAMLAALDAI